MLEPIAVTALPVLFLIALLAGGAVFRRQNIDIDGKAPINKALFRGSKYGIALVWVASVARAWGIDISIAHLPCRDSCRASQNCPGGRGLPSGDFWRPIRRVPQQSQAIPVEHRAHALTCRMPTGRE
jgi:hypothetical protein